MSGICGILAAAEAAVPTDALERMVQRLDYRGPDGRRKWICGNVGLAHTLLATTPEALTEVQPLHFEEAGCTITADARLDNREELFTLLDIAHECRSMGDGELILRAYLQWGEACAERLLGDFAFALWDGRSRTLFCARDKVGIRQLVYATGRSGSFLFATEPSAIVASELGSWPVSEHRIADFLEGLEGSDHTSTFYQNIFRLPAAHFLVANSERIVVQRYWTLEPEQELQLSSDGDYAEAFLDVFTEAVRCRLRSHAPVGVMLSGGLDSSSVVAVASRIVGSQRLNTLSVVSPSHENCVETRAIEAALGLARLEPTIIRHDRMQAILPEIVAQTQVQEEPFDGCMSLLRAVYISARRNGQRVVLDGGGGDIAMNHSSYIARLMASGRWIQAYRATDSLVRFYKSDWKLFATLYAGAAWRGLVPSGMRKSRSRIKSMLQSDRPRGSLISPEFARRINLGERWARYENHASYAPRSLADDRAAAMVHPNAVSGQERYDRVAAASAVEARDPFTDVRLMRFCLRLPGDQLLAGGWPKFVMRNAMAGLLPEQVIRRRGKEHLGPKCTESMLAWHLADARWRESRSHLEPYVDNSVLRMLDDMGDSRCKRAVQYQDAFHLLNWLANLANSTSP